MPRIRHWWAAALIVLVLAWPTTAALAADLVPASPHHPQILICRYTIETDNIFISDGNRNPFYDDLGNEWAAYYDITRDSGTNRPCDIRVTMRIFNPASDGSWQGTADVYADDNGVYDSYSYGQVSGSGTYQYHFVWHGPWFGADNPGSSYAIEIDEFNGSNAYARAYTSFVV